MVELLSVTVRPELMYSPPPLTAELPLIPEVLNVSEESTSRQSPPPLALAVLPVRLPLVMLKEPSLYTPPPLAAALFWKTTFVSVSRLALWLSKPPPLPAV